MTAKISTVPPDSVIYQRLQGASFYDCHAIDIPPTDKSALALYLQVVADTPGWVNALMALRNRMVQLVGLKNLGHLGDVDAGKPAIDYRVGDRVGIFSIIHLADEEVILTDIDRHLRVELSLRKQPGKVSISTVVHTHNLLGRFYMLFVTPLHRRIVPATLRRAKF